MEARLTIVPVLLALASVAVLAVVGVVVLAMILAPRRPARRPSVARPVLVGCATGAFTVVVFILGVVGYSYTTGGSLDVLGVVASGACGVGVVVPVVVAAIRRSRSLRTEPRSRGFVWLAVLGIGMLGGTGLVLGLTLATPARGPVVLVPAVLIGGALLLALALVLTESITWLATRNRTPSVRVATAGARIPVAIPLLPPAPPRTCPRCGSAIAAGSPGGLCPRCLLGDVLPPSADRTSPYAGPDPAPAVEDVAGFFPHLEVIRLLGEGGMGAVYLARQPALDRLVALKLIRARDDDPTFAERFAREAQAMARLNHPHVVAVYESGVAGELPYLVMEYVNGPTLRDAMRGQSLTPAAALAVVPQICDALEYAHTQGVVHRDVKPENILLDAAGRVKIADFGLAKVSDHGGVSLTRTHQAMGTPHYMAPEQWERPAEVDHRADIYALGVVLYELLTGELPLGRFDPPSVKARVDARLDELVLRALAKEPARRYQHASDVKIALAQVGAEGWVRTPTFREYKSRLTFLGWPLVHVTSGLDPATGRPKVAKGWVAVSSNGAVGLLAIAGGHAYGGVALAGGMANGVFAFAGGMASGLFAVAGGCAFAVAFAAAGGVAVSLGMAVAGGFAGGTWAVAGGYGAGPHVIDSLRPGPFENPLDDLSDDVIEPVGEWFRGLWNASPDAASPSVVTGQEEAE